MKRSMISIKFPESIMQVRIPEKFTDFWAGRGNFNKVLVLLKVKENKIMQETEYQENLRNENGFANAADSIMILK